MNASMIINHGKSHTFNNCPACRNLAIAARSETPDTLIPIFYSAQHAHDEGWRKTSRIKYCDPNIPSTWICPECAAKEPER